MYFISPPRPTPLEQRELIGIIFVRVDRRKYFPTKNSPVAFGSMVPPPPVYERERVIERQAARRFVQ